MQAAQLYREEILDHYQSPHNFGKLEGADSYARQTNPLCGDDISIWVKFRNNILSNVSFDGKGCAICMAGASMLTDHVKGKGKHELTKFSENDMLDLLGITVSETRKKCALLSLAVLKDCMYATQSKS